MKVKIEDSWKELLQSEFDKPYFLDLANFVRAEYQTNVVYPPARQIFSAFDRCPVDSLKVVIIGQDPYHGHRQANGLCFSVNDGISQPPSLQNIFKEIYTDLGIAIPVSGNLERWAIQGVLLLNAILTVRRSSAGSHRDKGWEVFTDSVIRKVSQEKEKVVFMLWGAYAQEKQQLVDADKHLVLKSAHPSPFSADRGFFGNKHFSKTNEYLVDKGKQPIEW